MIYKSCLLLVVFFLNETVADFEIYFGDGKIGIYRLNPLTEDEANMLSGSHAVVRKATFVSCKSGKFIFGENADVVLKIAREGALKFLINEKNAYSHIHTTRREMRGIAMVEKELGVSLDLKNDANLNWPEEETQFAFVVLVMQPLGTNLLSYLESMDGLIGDDVLNNFYDKLFNSLRELHGIDFVHGDIKPQNILLNQDNDPLGDIYLTDLGLSVFKGSNLKTPGGDMLYASAALLVLNRIATKCDDRESGIFTMIILASNYLPWVDLNAEMTEALENEDDATADSLLDKIKISKYDFQFEGDKSYNTRPKAYMKDALMEKLSEVRENEPDKVVLDYAIQLLKQKA